jgi:hypothetical protein
MAGYWWCPVCAEFIANQLAEDDWSVEQEGEWECYEEHCVRCYNVLMLELGYRTEASLEDDEDDAA